MKKNIIIVNNEKCSEKNGLLYCQNLEIKSMGMGLSNKYNLKFLLRKADVQPVYKIDKFDVKLSSNIFSFIKNFKSSTLIKLLFNSISSDTFDSLL